MDKLAVVIPVYNEEGAIGGVLEKWVAMLGGLKDADWQIWAFNDGSKDGSLGILQEWEKRTEGKVRAVDKPNSGHGPTILQGYRTAAEEGCDWVFQVDSDDEMGPERFPALWAERAGHDFLVGWRDGRRQPWPRKIVSWVSRRAVSVFYGKTIRDVNTPYRLMRVTKFAAAFGAIPADTFAPNVVLSGLAAAPGFRRFEMPVPQRDRQTGEVSIKKWKLARAAARSFGQTVAFSFRRKVEGQGTAAAGVIRLGLSLVFLLGALVALFGIGTPKMLGIGAALCAAAWLLRGQAGRLAPFAGWIRRHPGWALGGVLAVGLALRAAFFWGCLHGNPGPFQPGDGWIFFDEAAEMASGAFPETKSWVTVGGYALSMRLFGMSYLPPCALNVLLQTVCVALLWAFGRRLFGVVAGALAAAALFWSPLSVASAFQLYSEHFFFPLVLLEFMLLGRWLARRKALCAAGAAATALLALWTKPDAGILAGAGMAFVFCADALLWRAGRRRVLIGALAALAVAACGFAGARWVNQTWHGTTTFLCSEDGAWPQYFGANRETGGMAKMEDKLAVYETYRQATGVELEFRPNHCPPELAPLVKDETRRRWASMGAAEKARHVLKKEAYTWQTIWTPPQLGGAAAKGHTVFKVAVWLAACAALLGLSRRVLASPRVAAEALLGALPVLYLLGMFACEVLVEANLRYSWCANVFLPLYFGAALSLRPEECKHGN
jgi:glycosyltransferase involved in cell wall biosynthesis